MILTFYTLFFLLTPSRSTALEKASRRQNREMGSILRAVAQKKTGQQHTSVSFFDRTLHLSSWNRLI